MLRQATNKPEAPSDVNVTMLEATYCDDVRQATR